MESGDGLITMNITKPPSPSPSLDPKSGPIDIDHNFFSNQQIVSVTGPQVILWNVGSIQIRSVVTSRKTILIEMLPNYFLRDQVYHARLTTMTSLFELRRFHILHMNLLELLYERIEKECKDR